MPTAALLFGRVRSDRRFASSSPALERLQTLTLGFQLEAVDLQSRLCGCTLDPVSIQGFHSRVTGLQTRMKGPL